jgi:tape measure domain-containing protein
MADAAQLKLQVGLDLAFFRQQLALLGTTATSYSLPINIDRLGIQKEITKLGRNISGRKYTLKITSDVSAINADVIKLQKALENVGKESVNVQITGTGNLDTKEARKIRTALRKSILANGGKIRIPATILAAITKDDVTAFTRAAQSKLSEIALNVRADITSSADGLDTKEVRRIRVALHNAILSNGGKIKIPATVVPKIGGEEVTAFQKAVNSKFAGITIKVRAELEKGGIPGFAQGPHGAAALAEYMRTQGLSGGNVADVGRSERLRKQLEQQRVTQLRGLAKEEGLTGYSKLTKDPLIDKLVRELTSEAAERILGNVQNMLRNAGGLNPARRGAFPYVAKTGPIEPKVLFAEAAQRAAEIDAQAARQSRYIAQQQESLRGTAGRFLPSAKETITGDSTQSQAVKAFYDRLRNTERVFAQNFSANSYLPAATRSLASAMDGAAKQLRVLSTTRIAGALPSGEMINARRQEAYRNILSAGSIPTTVARPWERKARGTPMLPSRQVAGLLPSAEMMAPLRFSRAAAKAAKIDAVNAARRQEELKVNAENAVREKAAATRKLRESFAGLPPIQAPSIGQENAPLSRAATYSLNKARRILGMPIGPSSVYAPNPFAGAATVPPTADIGGGSALPPAGTTSNYSATARRAAWAQTYQQSRPMQAPSVPPPMQPPGPPGPPTPPTPPGGGRGGFGSFGSFGGAMPNISLPGAGLVRELGDQFGYAAKQVLLFGTTYRALAFLTDFPAKVGEAVAQLQSFRNTLQAITPNADEFQKSNQFILDTVDKYNIPIQSARDGFTKLYASMEPAGFSGEQIQKLFLGISKASATLGLSSDKVDRVTYAFSQMASKGQLMSEEVTGQLGDVIPGALSIMAKAASMDIKTFKKAMEDGVFVGKAFTDVMSNVPIVLEQRFGKGAEGAAKTFQGQMNAMATATKMLYESFVPVGDLFTSKIVAPFTNGLQVLTEGFNAFFSGAATKTAGGSALFQELEKLRPTFKGIADNIKQLLPVLQSFATTLLGLGKILLQVVSNPFVGYLARVYLAVLPLTMAIQALNLQALIPMIGSLLRAIPAFIAFSTAAWNGASRTVALRIAMQATGQTATITGGQVALLSNTLKTAFVGTVVGAVVIGIGMIIERIMTLSSKMEEAKGNALRLQDSIKGMSKTELQVEENKLGRQGALLQGLQRGASGQKYALLNKQQEEMVMNLAPGSITRVAKAGKGGNKLVEVASGLKAIGGGLAAIDVTMLPAIEQKIQSLRQNIDSARLTLNASDQNTSLNLAPIPGVGGDPKAAKAAAAALTSQQALADKLSSDQTKTDIERQKTLFENEKSMINMAYDLREARANSFQKETIRFQKELFNIEMERQKAVLDANSAVTKAQGAVAGGTGMAGLTQYITGDPSQKGYQADHGTIKNYHDHLAFATRKAAEDAYKKLVAEGIKVTEFKGYGQGVTGPHSGPGSLHHQGLAMDVPGYQWKGAGAIGAKEYAGSARVRQVLGIEGQVSAGGKVTARQKRVALADQQTENALQDTKVKTTLAEAEALKKAEIAMVNYISSIAPVAEQDLQNQLLGKRIELMQSGVPEAFAETQMKIFEAQEKVRMAGEELDLTNQKQVEAYEKLKQSLPRYIALLEDAAVKQQQLGFTKTMKDLGDRAAMARALTPEAETRTRLQQQGYAGAQLETLFETEKATTKAEQLKTQMQGVASTIGDAFSTAFQGIINGSMSAQDALAGMFQSIGQSFVKMAMEMIAQQLTMITLGFIMKALGLAGAAAGAGSTPLPGSAPQMTPNAIVTPTGFQGMIPPNFAAKGASFSNGIAKFATGGIVNGPTLFPFADGGAMQMGLMGEAGPEAIMPLQRGADGSLGVRAAMGGNGMGGSSSPILNMSFETSTINGVEYVSRDQLEAAMAQTRRQASSDGAKRGMAMTLDKIQQSPQTRRRIGM